jgi:peptidase M23-like protein
LKTVRLLLLITCLAPGLAQAKEPVQRPVKKSCDAGVVLKLNASGASQGSLLLAQVSGAQPSQEFSSEWDGKPIPLWRETPASNTLHALIGVDLEKSPGQYEWKISWSAGDGQPHVCSLPVNVRAGKFRIERLTVEKQFVQPDPEQLKRVEEDQKKMKAVYETITPEVLWKGKFVVPLKGVSTGRNFGSRRILNGEARSPHTGVDLPAPTGTPVYAAQSGKVVLAENLYYAGNTVVIDHGFGIFTMYAHLSEIGVHAGDPVEASAEIGKVGATGRVTGPHLHWGLTIDHARVNGLQIVQRQP